MTEESLPKPTHAGKIRLGELELDVCVVSIGSRVERGIVQQAALRALGLPRPKAPQGPRDFLVDYGAKISESTVAKGGSALATFEPIRVLHPSNGQPSTMYRGEDFVAFAKFMLRARRLDALTLPQLRVAEAAELVVEAFAELGVIALVDEATGYQRERGDDALQRILDRLIATKANSYKPRFPIDFYREICRLRGWEFDPSNPAGGFAFLTNDIVYERIAPGALAALRELNPLIAPGVRARKLFQHLTPDEGIRLLDEHLRDLITLAKGAFGWGDFMRTVDRRFPIPGTQFSLPVDRDDGEAAE